MTAALLETGRLLMRNWTDRDAEAFHRLNSDDRVMEFFPLRRDFAQAQVLRRKLADVIDRQGYGFSAVERKSDSACLGFCGLVQCQLEPHFAADEIEVGWRLLPEFWGQGYATEAARAWLRFGFEKLNLPRIVSFAVDGNRRSTAVMERIGMQRRPDLDFDHPRVPDTHPRLKRHVTYVIGQESWRSVSR
jgi:RimJ/RimL family protein N-acetyltransferase